MEDSVLKRPPGAKEWNQVSQAQQDVKWPQDSRYNGAVNSGNNRELLHLTGQEEARNMNILVPGRFR